MSQASDPFATGRNQVTGQRRRPPACWRLVSNPVSLIVDSLPSIRAVISPGPTPECGLSTYELRDLYVSQSDSEQQLRIWKDLAIGKQMLMNEAASALKLKDDFTAEELRESLELAVKRANDADADIQRAREAATASVAEMERVVKATEKQRQEAENQRDAAKAEKEAAEQALATGRKDNADALKKAKRQVDEKQKELKAINVALADTPENIIKKLKALKKQKLDESNGRKLAEDSNRKLKKENREQKEELEKLQSLSKNTVRLMEAHKALNDWAQSAVKATNDTDVTLDPVPETDDSLLAELEAALPADTDTQAETDTREVATA